MFLVVFMANSQQIAIDKLGKGPFVRVQGGIQANGVAYSGTAVRDPFTYFLSGNISFTFAGVYNIPLQFTYSNQDFDFASPFKFNRLSLHPSYKWATAHLGDVAMSFSPYTVSGHQFTGGGIELSPKGAFNISALYGRFLRATEYDETEPQSIPAYERTGYGFKAGYKLKKVQFGLTLFKAEDEISSIEIPFPAELGVSPAQNVVASLEGQGSLFDKINVQFEYAVSGITEDTRISEARQSSGFLSFLLDENISTEYYNAFNLNINTPAGKGSVGAGYERIDPNYRTFGAYFFNNDLENITVNASQNLFEGKLGLNVNAGIQRDNLDDTKSAEMKRFVTAISLNYTPSEKLSLNGNYSNFQSFTNIRDQFDYINQVSGFDTVDTLDFRQVSQNAGLNAVYHLKKTKKTQQSVNTSFTWQNTRNEQEGTTTDNGDTSFYNAALGYSWLMPERDLNANLGTNISYNTLAETDQLTVGPTLSVSKLFFEKSLRCAFSASYNTSFTDGEQQNQVYNFRLGGSYSLLKVHNLSLNLLTLFRNSDLNNSNDYTATLGYSYSFDNIKLKRKQRNPQKKEAASKPVALRFKYRDVIYSGTLPQISSQIAAVHQSPQFADIPATKQKELKTLFVLLENETSTTKYKKDALIFLRELYRFKDFLGTYDRWIYDVVQKIRKDMRGLDYDMEKRFVDSKVRINEFEGKKEVDHKMAVSGTVSAFTELINRMNSNQKKLVGHRWIVNRFIAYNDFKAVSKPDKFMAQFKKEQLEQAFSDFETKKPLDEIQYRLEYAMIDFYYRRSLGITDPEEVELRYIKTEKNDE